ncbi:hypothetical protein MHU86_19719 [Fragilaria crotonensis]|nr:hypothetical protein MHU86_19719 [Fragilaria crotonensis]
MSPDRRGVDAVEKVVVDGRDGERKVGTKKAGKKKVAQKTVTKKKVAQKTVTKKKVAETGNKTSPSVTSVRNLGNSPRVPGVGDVADGGKSLPTHRDERRTRPTHVRMMSLLSMAVVPEARSAFRQRFRTASGVGCNEFLCQTRSASLPKLSDVKAVPTAFGADMFPSLTPVGVPQRVLRDGRGPQPGSFAGRGVKRLWKAGSAAVSSLLTSILMKFVTSCPANQKMLPLPDYFYRAAILFLPQCGVFYCHRDRHIGDAGVPAH